MQRTFISSLLFKQVYAIEKSREELKIVCTYSVDVYANPECSQKKKTIEFDFTEEFERADKFYSKNHSLEELGIVGVECEAR